MDGEDKVVIMEKLGHLEERVHNNEDVHELGGEVNHGQREQTTLAEAEADSLLKRNATYKDLTDPQGATRLARMTSITEEVADSKPFCLSSGTSVLNSLVLATMCSRFISKPSCRHI